MASHKVLAKKAYSFVGRLITPVSYLFILANRFAWEGDHTKEFTSTAPAKQWLKRIFLPLLMSAILYAGGNYYIKDFGGSLSELIRNSYPSVLGFAIGLFALVVSSDKFENMKSGDGGLKRARLLSVDMAYPLHILFTVMIANYLIPGDVNSYKGEVLGVFNIYSIILIYDMIAVVYMYSIKKKDL